VVVQTGDKVGDATPDSSAQPKDVGLAGWNLDAEGWKERPKSSLAEIVA